MNRRIRLAFCIDSFAIGGTELNALRTAEALDPTRIDLHVFHLQTHGPLRARYERLGVPLTHVPIPNLYSPRTALQGMRLARTLNRLRIDIVHAHDIYTNIFTAPWVRILTGCALITSRRWWYEAPRPALVSVNRWSYRLAHRVLANSSGVANLLAREERVAKSKIAEIPNFLDESAFLTVTDSQRDVQRQAWGTANGSMLIGIVARLSPVKNHALLLRAMAQLDANYYLVIIGDGPTRTELEQLARELRIQARVHFAGEVVSPLNLHQYFDVSVLCSRSEGFPNSVIEAMAAARPVVATPVGGVLDVVKQDATGLLVSEEDPTSLAGALRRLREDALLRKRIGVAGQELVRLNYHRETVINKLMLLYEQLAQRSEHRLECYE